MSGRETDLPGMEEKEPDQVTDETEDYDDDSDDVADDPDYEPETAKETVKRVLEEAKEKASRDDAKAAGEKGAPKAKDGLKQPSPKQKPQGAKGTPAPVSPPSRLNAQEKELFSKLPPELQASWGRISKDEERRFTQGQQQLAAAQREASHIVEAVRPYLLAHPELMQHGYTESRLVSELIATHKVLTNTENPKAALSKWLDIGAQMGVDEDTLSELSQQFQGSTRERISANQIPEFSSLQEELNSIKSWIGQAQSVQHNATVNSIVSELEAVRNEQDGSGNYIYPELFDDSFLDSAKPLVSTLVGTVPNLSYGDALRRAYITLTGKIPQGNPNQAQRTKLPAPTNNIEERAMKAAVSVRGKSAPASAGELTEIPKEALKNPRASVQWAINQLRRG